MISGGKISKSKYLCLLLIQFVFFQSNCQNGDEANHRDAGMDGMGNTEFDASGDGKSDGDTDAGSDSGIEPTGDLIWAKNICGEGPNEGNDVSVFPDGSFLITGRFSGSIILGKGESKETSMDGSGMFIARYNSDGSVEWARVAGPYANGYGVAAVADGSAIVTGAFHGSVIFGEGDNNEKTLISESDLYDDIFIARYDAVGSIVWAKSVGGKHTESQFNNSGMDITAMPDASSLITGRFGGEVTFGKGESNEITLSGEEYTVFTAKYTPNGKLDWATKIDGGRGNGIAAILDGTSYVTGSSEANDIFIAKYKHDGEREWLSLAGGGIRQSGFGIDVIDDGSALVTGYFSDMATFGDDESNETVLGAMGWDDIFIAMYNSDGTLKWVTQAGGKYGDDVMGDIGFGITALADGSSIVTGVFYGTSIWGDKEKYETTLTAKGDSDQTDIFIARYDSDGKLVWVKSAGGEHNDSSSSIDGMPDGSSVVLGNYWSNRITFGEGEPNETVLDKDNDVDSDIFIAKFAP